MGIFLTMQTVQKLGSEPLRRDNLLLCYLVACYLTHVGLFCFEYCAVTFVLCKGQVLGTKYLIPDRIPGVHRFNSEPLGITSLNQISHHAYIHV